MPLHCTGLVRFIFFYYFYEKKLSVWFNCAAPNTTPFMSMRTNCSELWTSCSGRQDKRWQDCMFCCVSLSFIYSLGYWAVFRNPAVLLFSCKCVIIKLSWVELMMLKLTTFAESVARLLWLFHHFMFVERLVSAHSIIKSGMRASMSRETLNDYVTVKESMDAVSTFDPRHSIAQCLTLRQRRPKTSDSVEKVQKYLTNM